jgi:uncharacterized membrane protein YgdD (TMEM256/DUF423 family)
MQMYIFYFAAINNLRLFDTLAILTLMDKQIIFTAAILGALAVVLGAFGAHGLRAYLQPQQIEIWNKGVQYHFYHVFALLLLAALPIAKGNLVYASYWCFTLGILFFSGSLYLLSCREALKWDWLKIMGPITPVGGLLFIAGWVMLAMAALRK